MTSILEFLSAVSWWIWLLFIVSFIGLRDCIQKTHTISRNFPVIVHIRYLLKSIGPRIKAVFSSQ